MCSRLEFGEREISIVLLTSKGDGLLR
uniref:Uncharacterized protein n=1 Tax=Arundo donax TaxID=35708 RepID=A0A0A9HB83_ARUDO